ncbi:phage tail protein [Granulicella arctica]|uniref:Microcystin-dependent protein n=1 Tax=Granulicella arctica TaxID=940613 RepID=A0A7Y9PIW8_9BACT|nr:tail fiber protein [Granulicella arctica]NYF80595.1 microcystin-dependent protein [Granulicella arctica]
MSEPFLGQISTFGFNFPPQGWAFCNGQLLAISQNQALFSLLGTQYGGNGITTFALPNLQGSFALDTSSSYPIGQAGGEANHTLTIPELPAHSHSLTAASVAGALPSPAAAFPGVLTDEGYSGAATTTLGSGSSPTGGSQPHQNMPPYLVVNFCIALVGIFPSRN